jgi:hypothetical protein
MGAQITIMNEKNITDKTAAFRIGSKVAKIKCLNRKRNITEPISAPPEITDRETPHVARKVAVTAKILIPNAGAEKVIIGIVVRSAATTGNPHAVNMRRAKNKTPSWIVIDRTYLQILRKSIADLFEVRRNSDA